MRGVNLENGQFVRIGVAHNDEDGNPLFFNVEVRGRLEVLRGTQVRVSFPIGDEYEAIATCSLNDNFNKLEGRRVAITKLLRRNLSFLSKADKRKIFENVCPEYCAK